MAENKSDKRRRLSEEYAAKKAEKLNDSWQVIHLTSSLGEAVLYNFRPHAVRPDSHTGHVYATAELFGRIYKVRMMDKMPDWRVCDEKGHYLDSIFPEVNYLARRQNTTNSEETVKRI